MYHIIQTNILKNCILEGFSTRGEFKLQFVDHCKLVEHTFMLISNSLHFCHYPTAEPTKPALTSSPNPQCLWEAPMWTGPPSLKYPVFIKYKISYSLDKLPKMCEIPWQNCTGVSQTTLDASIVVPFEFHSENMWVFHLRTSPCTWRQAALTYSQKFAAWILIHAYPNQIQLDTHRKGQPWLVLCLKWTLASCCTQMSQNWMMKDKILSKGRSEAAKTKAPIVYCGDR